MSPLDAHPVDLEASWREFGSRLRAWLQRRVRQPADADDLLQDVFLRLAQSPPTTIDGERIGAWLYRVARNALIDFRRRQHVRRAEALDDSATPDAEEPGAGGSIARCLEPMLRTLPERYERAVRAADLEGRSQKELAQEQGLSYSALKSRVQRGRAMLRDTLVACCQPDEDLDCEGCEPDACA